MSESVVKENYFRNFYDLDLTDKIEKKNGLSYVAWANAWAELKKVYPMSFYTIYERPDGSGINYFTDGKTCWAKTGVTVVFNDGTQIEHIEELPVMDARNRSIMLSDVTSFDVNKAIQRSLTKACGRHGIGLYVYAGEDLPEEVGKQQIEKAKASEELAVARKQVAAYGTKAMHDGLTKDQLYAAVSKHNDGNQNPATLPSIEACAKVMAELDAMLAKLSPVTTDVQEPKPSKKKVLAE